jgi:hypothetical protein
VSFEVVFNNPINKIFPHWGSLLDSFFVLLCGWDLHLRTSGIALLSSVIGRNYVPFSSAGDFNLFDGNVAIECCDEPMCSSQLILS